MGIWEARYLGEDDADDLSNPVMLCMSGLETPHGSDESGQLTAAREIERLQPDRRAK
jgi:hypothetical protein